MVHLHRWIINGVQQTSIPAKRQQIKGKVRRAAATTYQCKVEYIDGVSVLSNTVTVPNADDLPVVQTTTVTSTRQTTEKHIEETTVETTGDFSQPACLPACLLACLSACLSL